MEEKIGVVLVNYNGKQYNDKCIASILSSTVKEQIHIIVVDNASTDGSLELLRRNWAESREQVMIISLKENYGFSRANNEGIRVLQRQGIRNFLLLNNDTEIDSHAIEKMFRDQKRTGAIVVPKIFYADKPDIIWCAGGGFSKIIKKQIPYGYNKQDNEKFRKSGYCDFANGCCLFLTEEILNRLGFLDESFFLYSEDTEYSLRAKERGVPIWYCADALVYHKVNGSSKGNERPENAYYITRNWLMCSRMHMGKRFIIFCIYFFCNRLAWAVIWAAQGKWRNLRAIWQGVYDYCRWSKDIVS